MKLKYTRILVKISGEQLAGADGSGINKKIAKRIAAEVAQAISVGTEVVIMVGGGNFIRGAQIEGSGIKRVTGDFMGMLATLINAIALNDIFAENSVPSRILTSIVADQVADQYTQRRALHQLTKGRVVILGGGVARPYLTTDTAALNLALELDCDLVCKITKVDGVYDRDPVRFADAKLIPELSFTKAVEDENIRVMDKAALALALEYKMPIVVCDLDQHDNLKKVALGEKIGTLIS
ncbi:MAG TPA: UMP kinase [Candidatus Saccharimonadales bacterium]|nr:UMP kinase [Candidatus Saccharimonadales bacterium]